MNAFKSAKSLLTPKKIKAFFRDYKQLGFVIISIILAGILHILGQSTAGNIVLGASASINVVPLVWGMVQDLRDGTYGVDILAATAIITAVLLGEYWAAMIVVLMLTGGEALEDYAETRAKSELTSLLKNKPRKAHLIKNGKTSDITVSKITVGDRIKILPGEVVPVDCKIIEGNSSLDEASLTGESLPVEKTVGDTLLSGSINLEGAITAEALHTAADSQYEQIIKLVKSAAASKSPFVRMADRYAVPFTIAAYIIAGSAWFASGDPLRFLQVIVVATPCPLILGAPIALISGMSRATKHGIIIKTGSSLEQLAAVQTVAFDKTGTLTYGQPKIKATKVYGNHTKDTVLRYAAALEQSSNHILAQAIVNEAEKESIHIKKAKNIKELSGLGLIGTIEGKTVLIGRLQLLEDQGIKINSKLRGQKETTTYIAINGELAGSFTFIDELRSESKGMIAKLKKLGVRHVRMLTGDNESVAQTIAKKLGITDVNANCLPADKMQAIEKTEHRPLAFVGDGVNDAPVLTAADVGIALGARGSTAASESADVVIMLDDLNKVSEAVEISQRTLFIAKQSILIGIIISLGLMGIFWTGRFSATQGAFIQEVVDIIVILNALRAHGSWKKSKQISLAKRATT
jgi:heavy metal translocating P-type ATPase